MCQIYELIKNFFTISEGQSRLSDVIIPSLTGLLTVYFAGKAYFLEKKVYNLNNFHGFSHVNIMVQKGSNFKYLRFMFTNSSNVEGEIENIGVKTSPIKYKDKFKNLIKTGSIYNYILVPAYHPLDVSFGKHLPQKVKGLERMEIFMEYEEAVNNLNETLYKTNSLLKEFIFTDTNGNEYSFKPKQKLLPDFIYTKENLKKHMKIYEKKA